MEIRRERTTRFRHDADGSFERSAVDSQPDEVERRVEQPLPVVLLHLDADASPYCFRTAFRSSWIRAAFIPVREQNADPAERAPGLGYSARVGHSTGIRPTDFRE